MDGLIVAFRLIRKSVLIGSFNFYVTVSHHATESEKKNRAFGVGTIDIIGNST